MNWRLPKVDGFARRDGVIWRELGRGQTGAWRSKDIYIPAWRVILIGVGLLVAGFILRRYQPFELLIAWVTIQVIMGVPQLCTLAYRILGEFWMLLRFETLSEVIWIALAIPPLVMALEKVIRFRILQCLLTLLVIPIGIRHAYFKSPYSWDFYTQRASANERTRHKRELLPLLNLSGRLQAAIPEGSIIATHPHNADYLGMLVDASFLVSERSSSGVRELGIRRVNLKRNLSFDVEEEERGEFFKKYGVTHVVMGNRIYDWIPVWTSEVGRVGRWKIAPVWNQPDFTQMVIRDIRRGTRAMKRKDYGNAVLAFERVVQDERDREDIWFRLGNARLWTDDSGGAIEAYEAVIDLEPTYVNALLMLGNAYLDQQKLEEAKAIYEKTIEVAVDIDDLPIAASAAYNLANIFYGAGDWDEAVRYYELAVFYNPYHVHAPVYLEQSRLNQGSLDGSEGAPGSE